MECKFDNDVMVNVSNARKLNEKLENRIKVLEMDLEDQIKKYRESSKLCRTLERNAKDIEYQLFQEKRNTDRMEVIDYFLSFSLLSIQKTNLSILHFDPVKYLYLKRDNAQVTMDADASACACYLK